MVKPAPSAPQSNPSAAVPASAPIPARLRSLLRNATGWAKVSTGQPRSCAIRRRARSGFTTVGNPTAESNGRSVIESEYARHRARS